MDCGEPYTRQGASFTVLCDGCQEKREAPDPEEAERLQRIEASAPPASSFDGRLQQWRDTRDEEPELEVSWNGRMGHDGKSLTDGKGLGSSLAGTSVLHR